MTLPPKAPVPKTGKPATKKAQKPKPARPLSAQEKAQLAKARDRVQQIEAGKEPFAKALGLDGKDAKQLVDIAREAYARNDFIGAADAAFVALAIDDGNADAWLVMGVSMAQRRRSEPARQALQQLLAIDPKHIEGWVHLAEVEIADMKATAAAAALKKAIELDPQARTPHGLRAQLLVVESLPDE